MIPFIGVALSAVAAAISSIGPAVAGFCTTVLPKLGFLLTEGLEALKVVMQIVNAIASIYDIFQGDENAENMGDRALQAAAQGITSEHFDDHDEYMDALRNFPLDDIKSAQIPIAEKVMAGFALVGRGLDEKFNTPEGTMSNLWVLVAANPAYFSAEKLTKILQSGADITSIVNYFEGKLGGGEALETEDKLVHMEKTEVPDSTEKSIREQIYGAADAVQRYGC